MCEIYVKADPALYESRSRSLRMHGYVTKIRLENLFWDILAELAAGEGMSTNQLITKLYDEIIDYRGEMENFSSFLRVTCLRYLTLQQQMEQNPVRAPTNRMPPKTAIAAPSPSFAGRA